MTVEYPNGHVGVVNAFNQKLWSFFLLLNANKKKELLFESKISFL